MEGGWDKGKSRKSTMEAANHRLATNLAHENIKPQCCSLILSPLTFYANVSMNHLSLPPFFAQKAASMSHNASS
jgi:hypothetical protein